MRFRCCLCLVLLIVAAIRADMYEDQLYKDLRVNYNPLERPVDNNSHPVKVFLGVSLQQIVDLVSNSNRSGF